MAEPLVRPCITAAISCRIVYVLVSSPRDWYFPSFTHFSGIPVNYRLITGTFTRGFAVGAIAMFWTAVVRMFFANAWYGLYPLAFGMLPFLVAAVSGRPLLLQILPVAIRRLAPPALALLLPLALWLLYGATDGLAMIDGTSSPIQFAYLLLLGAVFAGLPIDAVAAADDRRALSLHTGGWMLAGLGAGIAVICVLQDALSLPLLLLVQVIAAAGTLLSGWNEAETAPPAPPRAAHGAVQTGKSKTAPSRFPSPAEILLLKIPGLLAFTLPFVMQTIAETPVASAGSGALLLAGTFVAAGIGLLLAGRRRDAEIRSESSPRATALPNHSVIAAIAAALIFSYLFRDYWIDFFGDFYAAWYGGGSAGFGVGGILPLFSLGVLALATAAAVRDGAAPRWDIRFPLTATVGAGLLAAFFLRAIVPLHVAGYVPIIAALLLALYEFARWFRKNIAYSVSLAAIILACIYAFPVHQPEFRNFFDPVNFQIASEERSPAGRMTMLRSRDYDDRYHALFWNQTVALTQSSRTVQSDLYRMGHLPMLMRGGRARVLMLGLGSSLPLEAVAMHDPASMDCVEPMAATLRLANQTRLQTKSWTYLEDVRFHNERVPSFLARAQARYDVIISAEPLATPAPAPELLTETYFRDAARLLANGGVFMQWLPVARLDLASMRRVFAAVLAAFPHAELWMSSADPESAMIGVLASNAPFVRIQPSPLRFTRLRADPVRLFHLQQIQLDRFALVAACFATDAAGLRSITADAAPFTAFDGLRPLRDRSLPDAVADVDRLLSARVPPERMFAGMSDSVRALTGHILDARPAILRARTAVLGGNDSSAVTILAGPMRAAPQNGEVRRVLGDMLLRQAAGYVGAGSYPTAVALLNTALQLLPLNTYMLRLFMIASFNIGDREASGLAIDGIKRIDPSHAGFRDNQATIRAQQGATDDALLLYENAITLDQRNEEFYCNMASFHYSQGRTWEAIRVLDEATTRAYYPAKAWYLKGMFYGEQGRLPHAKNAFERYLETATPLDPNRVDVERRLEQMRDVKEE
jgi:spermidine synthase/tetratricopeptide (TPR) repeat protein